MSRLVSSIYLTLIKNMYNKYYYYNIAVMRMLFESKTMGIY